MNKELTISKVETMVADSVETIYAIHRPDISDTVDRNNLYRGKRTLINVCARFFVYRTLHDIYGFSYRELSAHSGTSTKRIMRAVGKIRDFIFIDPLFINIKKEIDKRITNGLI